MDFVTGENDCPLEAIDATKTRQSRRKILPSRSAIAGNSLVPGVGNNLEMIVA
jgi:hypothetical protein